MSTPKVVTGTDTTIQATWKVNNAVVPIAADSAVEARLVSSDHLTVHTPVLTLSDAAPGADWPAGIVAVEIPGADTVDVEDQGFGCVQLKVTPNGGKSKSGFFVVNIVKGNIA